MASACIASASASLRRPAPSARAIAAEIPPPMAPADIICISMSTGKTSVTPARASVPSLATKYVSMRPTEACTNMTSTFGVACRARLAGGEEEPAALEAREERTDARARERRHATDAGDEQELLPQHASDIGRDLVRNAALLECAGDSLNAFGHGPAELAEDDPAGADGAKDDDGTAEVARDVDVAGEHCARAKDG